MGITIAIQLPNLGDHNCELRHEKIQFHDLPSEDLVVHLRKFLINTNTVTSLVNALDYIKLTVFPFSLKG